MGWYIYIIIIIYTAFKKGKIGQAAAAPRIICAAARGRFSMGRLRVAARKEANPRPGGMGVLARVKLFWTVQQR